MRKSQASPQLFALIPDAFYIKKMPAVFYRTLTILVVRCNRLSCIKKQRNYYLFKKT
jgi:hypothetical protein